ncbi:MULTISPECIES: cell division protein FtsL [Thioclava]|uniref:cell division protein FtsL n=1 Tax=Thioclava TaxID=285107 RepID=UPI000C37AF50|nr:MULTISPECIES: cell division protein FtsL [Thioclava]MAQ36080.1 cell division protein FtsL [Thioclava sp.]MPQ93687.1 cell division protein FtsL [Thioclava sp. JE_KL1]
MRLLAYLAASACVLALAFWAYHVNYDTQDRIDELRDLNREIASLNEGLSVLNAEWAYLNRPQRLRELVNLNFTSLRLLPMTPEQFGTVAQIAYPTPQADDADASGTDLSGLSDPIEVKADPEGGN